MIITYPDLNTKTILLSWFHKFGNKGYNVYRKYYDGSYSLLTTEPIKVNFYKDATVDTYHEYDYKVTVIDQDDNETTLDSVVTSLIPAGRTVMGNVHQAIKEITKHSFRLGKAEQCIILVKPQVGNKCPDCWNQQTRDIDTQWCTTCQNTSFEGGYIRFEDVYVRFSNTGTQLEPTEMGYEMREARAGQIADYPLVHNEDIIIRPNGERLFVYKDVRQIVVQSLLIKQIFNLKEVMVNTPLYDL